MIVHLKTKLQKLKDEGKIEALKNSWQEKIKAKFNRPSPVQGITRTKDARLWRHDPTLVIGNDIKTPDGHILAKKGDRINPLHTLRAQMGPQKGFLFIDGDDDDQVLFARKHLEHFDVVLIKGAPFEVQDELKTPVFFDQGGYLTSHYSVTKVPAFLSVKEDHLLIEEVVCEKS